MALLSIHFYALCMKPDNPNMRFNMEIDSLTNAQVAEALSASFSCETSDFLFDAEKVLTEKERKIIALVYEYQLSSAEIARKLRTTRQNVNQCKKRAELKLRAYYEK